MPLTANLNANMSHNCQWNTHNPPFKANSVIDSPAIWCFISQLWLFNWNLITLKALLATSCHGVRFPWVSSACMLKSKHGCRFCRSPTPLMLLLAVSAATAPSLPTSLTLNCGNVAEKREQDAAYLAVRATDWPIGDRASDIRRLSLSLSPFHIWRPPWLEWVRP